MRQRLTSTVTKPTSPVIVVPQPRPNLISTGSTLLNLRLSDSPYGGYVPGSIVNIIGDSSSGKSFLLWSMFAEVVNNPLYDGYRIIYDEPERALHFQLAKLFGPKIGRVEYDNGEKGSWSASVTIQDWFLNVTKAIDEGTPFIYGLDSFDALTSEEELERNTVGKGGWKTEKAIASSEILRIIMSKLDRSKSLVVVLSQTRDKIGVMFGDKKTRSGGHALRFYSTHEIWTAVKKHIQNKNRDVGVDVRIKTKKNKLTGKLGEVEVPIIFDYGLDDIGSMVDWLIEEGFWKKPKGAKHIDTGRDFFNDFNRADLIAYIEKENLESKLISIVEESWNTIEESIKSNRKPKYGCKTDGKQE